MENCTIAARFFDEKNRLRISQDLLSQAYHDYDSFVEKSELTFNQAKTLIISQFSNQPSALILYGATDSITLFLGDSVIPDEQIQLNAFLCRNKTGQNQDVSANAEWLLDPNNNVVTVVNGLVTANIAGSTDVYAKFGAFETKKITVTVS
jgi:hypothetical protein